MNGWLAIYLRGVAMGAADLVPGVSGGTIAFVTGIYERLVDALGALARAPQRLWREGPAAVWRGVDLPFLAALAAGIATSLFSLSRLVNRLLAEQPVLVWGFFLGLIAASIGHVARRLPRLGGAEWLCLAAGAAVAAGVAFAPPLSLAISPPLLVAAGALAACAMILPGISGSFVLLLLGLYPPLIEAVAERRWAWLALFGAGAAGGLLAFAPWLSRLLHRHPGPTLATLTGLLAGSLAVVWPWQEMVAAGRRLWWPWQYPAGDPQLGIALAAAGTGALLVLALEWWGRPARA
ncbi:MAG: DUF368 domain-containing protein [Porticoccaceae bacterium]|nr:MAG: DUF368 domain-containing protein [Porticoccaceae bacterium]